MSHTSHGKNKNGWNHSRWCKIVGAGSQSVGGPFSGIRFQTQKKKYTQLSCLSVKICSVYTELRLFVTFCFLPKKFFFFLFSLTPLQERQILAAMTAPRQLVKNTYIYLVVLFPRGKYLGQTDKKFNGPSKYEKILFFFPPPQTADNLLCLTFSCVFPLKDGTPR